MTPSMSLSRITGNAVFPVVSPNSRSGIRSNTGSTYRAQITITLRRTSPTTVACRSGWRAQARAAPSHSATPDAIAGAQTSGSPMTKPAITSQASPPPMMPTSDPTGAPRLPSTGTSSPNVRKLARGHPAGHELCRHAGFHLDAEPGIEEQRASERVPRHHGADAAEGPELGGPAVDERLVRRDAPGHGERFRARRRESDRAAEATHGAQHHARGVEPDLRELEAVPHLGEGERVTAGHAPAACIWPRGPALEVHARRRAWVCRAARSNESEERQPHPLAPPPH